MSVMMGVRRSTINIGTFTGCDDQLTLIEQHLDTINSLLDPKGKVYDVMSEEQREGLVSLRTTLLQDTRKTGSLPLDLIKEKTHSEMNMYLLESFGGFQEPRATTTRGWEVVKSSMHAMNAIKFLEEKLNMKRCGSDYPEEFTKLSSEQQERLQVVLEWENLTSWQFNVLELNELTNGQPLLFTGWAILASPLSQMSINNGETTPNRDEYGYGFVEMGLSVTKLLNFLRQVESMYNHDIPYHNNIHAADVLQSVHALLQMGGSDCVKSKIQTLGLLVAAIIHDTGHPGTNNNFQVKSKTPLALFYNDQSVLENMHLMSIFKWLVGDEKKADLDIFDFLSASDFVELRQLIIDVVLRTDMTYHFEDLTTLKLRMMEAGDMCDLEVFLSLEGVQQQVLRFLLHMADISNQSKPKIFVHWAHKCLDEFFEQGDKEKELGLPVSPLCDRHTVDRAESQVGFINFVLLPAFRVLGGILPRVMEEVVPVLEENLNYWQMMVEDELIEREEKKRIEMEEEEKKKMEEQEEEEDAD